MNNKNRNTPIEIEYRANKRLKAMEEILTELPALSSIDDINLSKEMVRIDLRQMRKINIVVDNNLFCEFINGLIEKHGFLMGVATDFNLYYKALEIAYQFMLKSKCDIDSSPDKLDYYRSIAIFLNCKIP